MWTQSVIPTAPELSESGIRQQCHVQMQHKMGKKRYQHLTSVNHFYLTFTASANNDKFS